MSTSRRAPRSAPRAFHATFATVLAVLLASFGALAMREAPGEVSIVLPGRYGAGPDLGSVPALPIAVLLLLGALAAVAWAVFVSKAPWRYRRVMVSFPPIAYLVLMLGILGVFVADDPHDGGRIGLVVFSILLLALFLLGVTTVREPVAEEPASADTPA
jgi:drug/metabolite transporter (DMT)-like permease